MEGTLRDYIYINFNPGKVLPHIKFFENSVQNLRSLLRSEE